MRVIEANMEQQRNERAGETGDSRENPPINGILRHDSHMRKSGVTRPEIEPVSPLREASRLTAQPLLSVGVSGDQQHRPARFAHAKTTATRPGIEPGTPWEASRLTAQPPLAGSLPDFRTRESCGSMPLVGGFSPGSPVSRQPCIPPLLHTHLASPSTRTEVIKCWGLSFKVLPLSLFNNRFLVAWGDTCSPRRGVRGLPADARRLHRHHHGRGCIDLGGPLCAAMCVCEGRLRLAKGLANSKAGGPSAGSIPAPCVGTSGAPGEFAPSVVTSRIDSRTGVDVRLSSGREVRALRVRDLVSALGKDGCGSATVKTSTTTSAVVRTSNKHYPSPTNPRDVETSPSSLDLRTPPPSPPPPHTNTPAGTSCGGPSICFGYGRCSTACCLSVFIPSSTLRCATLSLSVAWEKKIVFVKRTRMPLQYRQAKEALATLVEHLPEGTVASARYLYIRASKTSAVIPSVVNLTPTIRWRRPWKILADPNLSSDLRAASLGFYNNIVATQQRKYSIHLTADPACPLCGNTDTALHM
ncbi:hypothetical protein PR048_026061, partial [Dryococelus australis]